MSFAAYDFFSFLAFVGPWLIGWLQFIVYLALTAAVLYATWRAWDRLEDWYWDRRIRRQMEERK